MSNSKGYSILMVDDEIEYQNVFSYIMKSHGYGVITCSSGVEAIEIFNQNDIDLVVTDLKMSGMDGLEIIKKIKSINPNTSIMVMTAFGTIESAVQAMKDGATGYFIKGSDPESLVVEINKLCKIKDLQISNNILKQSSHANQPFLRTKNPVFADVLDTCRKAAETDINVLLLGESGVGKEVLANYIHKLSKRGDRHFIPVNCQAFADGMVESELFGHEKGAFTGAMDKRIGRFEEANKGTLFLDEIGDLPASTQGKLLRVIENKSVERVGSNKSIDLDLRLISATNKNLHQEIDKGSFREDLMYRINTLEILIPPLRERQEDLADLISFFIEEIEKDQKKKIVEIDTATMDYLLHYDYPGNIRELRNILERLIALSDRGVIKGNRIGISSQGENRERPVSFVSEPLRAARAKFEKEYIENLLSENNGDMTITSAVLEITKRQLWNKISEYDISIRK